ncbi:MAG: hypothetical protein ACD_20C00383G0018 [uncultured bacterium]|nr:MAG: hypothetical protein ACD_20C00383G0018 [uncultured bacterium]
MRKFKFKLQSVLDARIKTLEDRQLALSIVQHRHQQAVKHLEYLYESENKTRNELETVLKAGTKIDFTTIQCHQNYIGKLKSDIQNQHKIIADIEIELEEKKQEVLQALKAKTMLEKLKEKALKEFKAEVERLDMLQIDEIATNRQKRAK